MIDKTNSQIVCSHKARIQNLTDVGIIGFDFLKKSYFVFYSCLLRVVHFFNEKRTDSHDFQTIFNSIFVKCLFRGVSWT